ncbi:hypothetical protein [Williamsia maris]|uniref:Uncharacterized protein n=1 Tax=Williamsia maris TaxID=72806 RepID=A0ABT1HL41_9NOCA|nr:hypothetical protein [Williamsia maris]MCP2178659.1 hypothetical protein [Williamsia maris]
MDGLIVAIGLPVTILCIIAVVGCVLSMAWAFGAKYPKVENYTLSKQWKREPLLLSATEVSPVSAAHHDASVDDLIGGSASGKW